MLEKIQTCSCKCNSTAVFAKDGNQSRTLSQDLNTRIERVKFQEKKVILCWVILAITLTALRCFLVPRNTEGSDIVTIVPTFWKIKVIIRKERGEDWKRFFFLILIFFFHGYFTQKGPSDPWSAEHIPVGWNQNPLWIILSMPCQDLHILPWVFSNPERIH